MTVTVSLLRVIGRRLHDPRSPLFGVFTVAVYVPNSDHHKVRLSLERVNLGGGLATSCPPYAMSLIGFTADAGELPSSSWL